MSEKRNKKREIRQNWKLLKKLRCSRCEHNEKGICDQHCKLLLMQTKLVEYEIDTKR